MTRLVESPTLSKSVDFCCEIVIPKHFEVDCRPEVTFDPTCITCVEGTCEQLATVTDPCSGEQIQCLKELKTFTVVGSIPFVAAVLVRNECGADTYLCCQDTVCVNELVSVCPDDETSCFMNGCEISVTASKEVRPSEICPDEQIVRIQGTFTFPS
jgi:hypothetical protein